MQPNTFHPILSNSPARQAAQPSVVEFSIPTDCRRTPHRPNERHCDPAPWRTSILMACRALAAVHAPDGLSITGLAEAGIQFIQCRQDDTGFVRIELGQELCQRSAASRFAPDSHQTSDEESAPATCAKAIRSRRGLRNIAGNQVGRLVKGINSGRPRLRRGVGPASTFPGRAG